jgi:hypothetical protein
MRLMAGRGSSPWMRATKMTFSLPVISGWKPPEKPRGQDTLGEYMNVPISSYSSGMGARLAFGMSMAIPFDCYLVEAMTMPWLQ